MTKDELTLEIAMRFAVALRAPAFKPDSQGSNLAVAKGYDWGAQKTDREIARFVIAMARTYAEEFTRGEQPAPVEPPPDDLDKTRIPWDAP